ncbi:hypothetical protein Acr_12g0006080 [Actinidia rufa]|uniref:Uncharacterized protein n=1 Tax=Actinidia rufa TaxID=165716 RepID=A0A7J0FJG3_9ERIC|nr:hypothetical protein Acr_12g0006080 [Actinidia rufa]
MGGLSSDSSSGEHNEMGTVGFYKCNRVLQEHVKTRAVLNDTAGIRVNKNVKSVVIEHRGYENASFLGKDRQNYLKKMRRLQLGKGDAAAHVALTKCATNFFEVSDLAQEFENRYDKVMALVRELREEFMEPEVVCGSNKVSGTSNDSSSRGDGFVFSKESTNIIDPLVLCQKVRPPLQKEGGVIEKAIKKIRVGKKNTNTKGARGDSVMCLEHKKGSEMQHIGARSYNGEQSFMVGQNYMAGQTYIGGQGYMNGQSHTAEQSQMGWAELHEVSNVAKYDVQSILWAAPNMVQGGGIPFRPSMLGEITGTNQFMIQRAKRTKAKPAKFTEHSIME